MNLLSKSQYKIILNAQSNCYLILINTILPSNFGLVNILLIDQ